MGGRVIRILVKAGELPQVKAGSIKTEPQVLVEMTQESQELGDVPTLQDVNLKEVVKEGEL